MGKAPLSFRLRRCQYLSASVVLSAHFCFKSWGQSTYAYTVEEKAGKDEKDKREDEKEDR
jgi:hypothetical protein